MIQLIVQFLVQQLNTHLHHFLNDRFLCGQPSAMQKVFSVVSKSYKQWT